MARSIVPITSPIDAYPIVPISAGSLNLAFAAADPVNKNAAEFGSHDALMIIALNAGGAATLSIDSALNAQNRLGDIESYAIGGGITSIFIARRDGWRQPDGTLHFEADSAAVFFAIVPLTT